MPGSGQNPSQTRWLVSPSFYTWLEIKLEKWLSFHSTKDAFSNMSQVWSSRAPIQKLGDDQRESSRVSSFFSQPDPMASISLQDSPSHSPAQPPPLHLHPIHSHCLFPYILYAQQTSHTHTYTHTHTHTGVHMLWEQRYFHCKTSPLWCPPAFLPSLC